MPKKRYPEIIDKKHILTRREKIEIAIFLSVLAGILLFDYIVWQIVL